MNSYKVLNKQLFSVGDFSIVPIRYEDRFGIMQWRNEQIYHLRQAKSLTQADQENYFQQVVAKLFDQPEPGQILFSFLKKGECIGYGGLVHINWVDKNAEISFIMDTQLEQEYFHEHWNIFLPLIEQVGFAELGLHKLYTYAFDLRPHLYEAIERAGYKKEAVLPEHCFFDEKFVDVIIHSKFNPIRIRKVQTKDKKLVFDWANDRRTRENSFNPNEIEYEEHSSWFDRKIQDEHAEFYMAEVNEIPAGLIRFEIDPKEAIIGINIAPEFRGKGYGSLFLKEACRIFRINHKNKISAYIKKDNMASVRSFEKVGFQFVRDTNVEGIPAFLLKL